MPVVRTGETEYEKELAKWKKPYRFERPSGRRREDSGAVSAGGQTKELERDHGQAVKQ